MVYWQCYLAVTWLVPHETAAVLVCMCLAVPRNLHFWQNDQDLLRATAVTGRWNGYQNKEWAQKIDHGKKNKKLFHYSCLNLWPFDHKSGGLTPELSLYPYGYIHLLVNALHMELIPYCVHSAEFPFLSLIHWLKYSKKVTSFHTSLQQ